MSARLRQAAPIVLMGVAVLLLIRIGYDVSWNRTDETAKAPKNTPAPTDNASISPSPTRSVEGVTRWTMATGPPVGDTRWSLAVTTSGGSYCAELATSLGTTTSSCGHDGRTLQVLRSSAGAGRTFLFGPVSRKAERVWITLRDGRIVDGSVYAVPRNAGAPFGLYLIVVKSIRSGEIVAVDEPGLLVGHAHVFISVGAERPFGWPDVYGNIIGYLPSPGDLGFASPGGPAPLVSIRAFLMAPLAQVDPRIERWWADRPQPGTDPDVIREWWAAYPLTRRVSPG